MMTQTSCLGHVDRRQKILGLFEIPLVTRVALRRRPHRCTWPDRGDDSLRTAERGGC